MQGEYGKMCTEFPRLIAVVMRKYFLQCVLLVVPSCSGMCVKVRLGRGVNSTDISGDGDCVKMWCKTLFNTVKTYGLNFFFLGGGVCSGVCILFSHVQRSSGVYLSLYAFVCTGYRTLSSEWNCSSLIFGAWYSSELNSVSRMFQLFHMWCLDPGMTSVHVYCNSQLQCLALRIVLFHYSNLRMDGLRFFETCMIITTPLCWICTLLLKSTGAFILASSTSL